MLNPFTILRELARHAVASGIADAVRDAAPADGKPIADLSALAPRALPPAESSEPKPRKARKPAEVETPAVAATPEPTPAAG